MRHITALIGFILFSASLAVGQSGCDSGEALNCNFIDTWCSWDVDTSLWSFDTCEGFSCISFTGSGTGIMTSRTACSTGGHTHCLRIRYSLYNNDIDLTVFARSSGANRKQVWNSTGQGVNVWYTADIPISSDREFRVILEAKKVRGSGRFFLDYITYLSSPCQPLETTTVRSSVKTVFSTEETTTRAKGYTLNIVPTDTAFVTTDERTTNSSSSFKAVSKDKEKASSSNVGLIVGVVIAVVVVVVVPVVIVVLCRQKRLHLPATCIKNPKRTDKGITGPTQTTAQPPRNNQAASSTGGNAMLGNNDEGLYLTPISHEYAEIPNGPNSSSSSATYANQNTPTPEALDYKNLSSGPHTSNPCYVNQRVQSKLTARENTTPSGPNEAVSGYVNHAEHTVPRTREDTDMSTAPSPPPANTGHADQQLYTALGARSPDNDYTVLVNTARSDSAVPTNPYVNQSLQARDENSRSAFRCSSDDPYEVM